MQHSVGIAVIHSTDADILESRTLIVAKQTKSIMVCCCLPNKCLQSDTTAMLRGRVINLGLIVSFEGRPSAPVNVLALSLNLQPCWNR